ncbi:MAG TPA: helix-turn-helix domain-containing protein [Thermoleophilaceae bacterium]|nr:helix-turn-helix domain-containing protein [Thermoleophilaceae bacterium]
MTGRLLTAREVGELVGMSPETILRWTRRGELPSIKLPGGAIRFREDALDGWLDERATAETRKRQPPRRPPPAGRLVVPTTPEDEE